MAHRKVRVGLVGANVRQGWGARAHIPALQALPDFDLVAVCTAHQETAEETAGRFGVPLAFHDYLEMVSHPDIDLVAVVVRAPLHYPIVMAALEAGKHVFCEWPLGTDLAQAEEMASLAQAQGVKTLIGLQARGHPTLLRFKELLEEGYVGDPLACHMTMFLPGLGRRSSDGAWAADRRNGAHALSISAGHAIDAMCFCVAEFFEVGARVTTQLPHWRLTDTGETVDVTAPDNVLVGGILWNGAVASVHVGSIPWHGSGWRLDVYGTEGSLMASSTGMMQLADVELRGAKGADRTPERLPIPERLRWVPEGVPAGPAFNVAQMYQRFADGLRGGEPNEADFALALRRHRLLDTIERASETGRRHTVLL